MAARRAAVASARAASWALPAAPRPPAAPRALAACLRNQATSRLAPAPPPPACRAAGAPRAPRSFPAAPRGFASAASSASQAGQFSGAAVDPHAHDAGSAGFGVSDLLAYLSEQYGIAQAKLEDQLTELAKILGYENMTSETRISYDDTVILMEEVGAVPLKRNELRRFVAALRKEESESMAREETPARRKKHALLHRKQSRRMKGKEEHFIVQAVDKADLTPEEARLLSTQAEEAAPDTAGTDELRKEDISEYFRVQNTKELLHTAKHRGDRVEVEHKCGAQVGVAARVTTELGTMIHFKPLGQWDKTMWEDWRNMRPSKDIHIRACKALLEEAHAP